MLSFFFGIVTAGAGVYGLLHMDKGFMTIVKSIVSLSCIGGGIIAMLAGISALKK